MKCPLCDSRDLYKASRCRFSKRPMDHFYICLTCGILFEDVKKLRKLIGKTGSKSTS